jgi:penicillin-binding protein 1A
MLALAQPAIRLSTQDGWLKPADISVTFLDRQGNEIGSRGVRRGESIPLEQYPAHLIQAVLATEDRHFFDHFGIDLPGTARALAADVMAGGVVQGGSSITQQLAKNLFLSNERTIERKINEAFLAMWLESRMSKQNILRLYLDRAYMGGGAFGIDAAAQLYFGKSVRDVNLAEAAMLAGLFKAPSRYDPGQNLPAARARANIVLDNMVDAGFVSEGQVFGARQKPAAPIERASKDDEHAPNYFLDWAFAETKRIADALPKSLGGGNFVVRTTLDMNKQRAAEEAIVDALRQYGREYQASQSATVLMDLDGGVRAMVGGRDYGESQFNRAVDALRQPGSSFKPYVYATALASGMKPNSRVVDEPICIGNWCPENYGRSYAGAMTLTQALTHSINSVAVRLSIMIGNGNPKLGRARIIETAKRMGVRSELPDVPSLPLGAGGLTVLEQTGAYATFANLGKAVTPHAVLDVRTDKGQVVWRFERDGKKPAQALAPQVAAQMIGMMNRVVEEGTGKRAQLDGIPAAGKTGTTNSYRDAWFVGYTGNFVCGVWFGNDDDKPTNKMTGGSLPADTWHEIMTFAHQGIDLKQLPGLPRPKAASPNVAARDMEGPQPMLLARPAADVLRRLAGRLDNAQRTLPGGVPQASAEERERTGQIR